LTPRFKRAWRRAVRRGKSLRSRARQSSREVRPENIVWIFGTGRSGSTWLGSIMGSLEGCAMWNEPLVGNLFGNFHYFRVGGRKPGRQYILGEPYKETWLGPMRDLVLGGAAARFPEVIGGGYLIIKEPNGSIGSPLLMEALPESRMIFLIRDPRDVVASSMDARTQGSWLQGRREAQRRTSKQDRNPNVYVRMRANSYVQQIEKTGQAYRAHGGRKVMVRYEDLRANTMSTMRHIYSALEMPVAEAELARSVEKNSWENIPEEEKGEGKKRRKAKPGGWREDLTPRQVEIVEDITAPLLNEFYPDTADAL
jgi:LPS sulfotransferase NodH